MAVLTRELSQALRRHRRRPVRAGVGVVTLGLGLAACAVAFGALDTVLLTPLPVEEQDELVWVWHDDPARGFSHVPFGPRAVQLITDGATTLSRVAALETAGARQVVAEGADGPYPIRHVRVAGDFFGTLGARPALGRLLDAADDVAGVEPRAVLAHGFWAGTLGADPAVVGRTLTYGGRAYRVVGIAEEGFDIPRGAQVWASVRGAFPNWAVEEPVGVELDIVGRLRPGVAPGQVAEDVRAALAADPALGGLYGAMEPVVVPLTEHVFGSLQQILEVVLAAALLVLSVALVNVVILLLTGGADAARSAAVRRALGAGTPGVILPLLADAAVLAVGGVAFGLGLAWTAVRGLAPWVPAELPRLDQIALDGGAVLFVVALALATVVAAGGVAGVVHARSGLRTTLWGGSRSATGGGESVRRALAGAQIALAVTSAVGAGLLVRSVHNLAGLELGYEAAGLSMVTLSHPHGILDVPDSYVSTLERVVEELEALPDIRAVAPTINPPLTLNGGFDAVPLLRGQPREELRSNPFLSTEAILPGYFARIGQRLLRGRDLGPDDGRHATPSVVVNETAARALWPGEEPLGQELNLGFPGAEEVWWRVVGVVEDARYRDLLAARPAMYLPLRGLGFIPPSRLLVRVSSDAGVPLRDLVGRALAEADPGVRVLDVVGFEDLLAGPRVRPRFAAAVLASFATLTLLLAMLGVYGAFSMLVQERTRELGVRRALGARARDLARLVGSKVLVVAAAGVVVGVLASLWLSTALGALLHGVAGHDPLTLVTVGTAALGAALLAGVTPAARAARADPVRALRAD